MKGEGDVGTRGEKEGGREEGREEGRERAQCQRNSLDGVGSDPNLGSPKWHDFLLRILRGALGKRRAITLSPFPPPSLPPSSLPSLPSSLPPSLPPWAYQSKLPDGLEHSHVVGEDVITNEELQIVPTQWETAWKYEIIMEEWRNRVITYLSALGG